MAKFPHRRHFLHLAAGAAALPAMSRIARAQTYPTRPITIVDPFPAGGLSSILARGLADKFSELLRQQVVVDQRGGAAGTLGTRQVARSAPDGYTLLVGMTNTLAIAPSLYPNAGYDPRKDFAPIGMIGMAPTTLIAGPAFPVHSIAELIVHARQSPGKVNFGSAGVGSVGHIAGELLMSMSGIKLSHVPYRVSGQVLTDLLGGHIPLGFVPVPVSYESARNGLVRMLGVTSLKRSSLLPEVLTFAEQGLPGYEVVLRYGLVVPVGTPRPIIERLNKELRAALASDDVRTRFAIVGAEPLASTSEEYAAEIDREETKWSTLVKALGLKGE
jgi:tripartite-type tricarboxylate transporter receptor subunit TctC